MTPEQAVLLKQWADKAGLGDYLDRGTILIDELLPFAALVAAHQRELDAKVCEAEDVATTDFAPGVQECIAAAIRGRGETLQEKLCLYCGDMVTGPCQGGYCPERAQTTHPKGRA